MSNARCVQNKASSSSGSSTSGGINYGPIGASGSHESSTSSSQSSSDCGDSSDAQHTSAALYYAHTDYHDLILAWSTCMQAHHDLVCWAEPQGDPNHLTIHIDWEILGPAPRVVQSNVQVGNRASSPALAQGTQLYLGDNLVYVSRNASDEDATVGLTGSDNGVSIHSCSVWVPKQLPLPPPDIAGLWLPNPVAEPPRGKCSCINSSIPKPTGAAPFLSPFANDAQASLRNDCATDVNIWGRLDQPNDSALAAPKPAGQTVAIHPVFSYISHPVRPHQTLTAQLGGAVGVEFLVSGCPADSFHRPGSPGQ